MEGSETVNCGYFFEGRCKGSPDLVFLRGSDCRNAVKDACCYVCEFNWKCMTRCDLLDVKEEEKTVERKNFLSEEERIEVARDVLSRLYLIPRTGEECGNCVYYLKPECPRRYSSDSETWRTQKVCEIFQPKSHMKTRG